MLQPDEGGLPKQVIGVKTHPHAPHQGRDPETQEENKKRRQQPINGVAPQKMHGTKGTGLRLEFEAVYSFNIVRICRIVSFGLICPYIRELKKFS